MAQIVLLADFTTMPGEIGYGRPLGPAVLASKARASGFDCIVINHFTRLENLFEVLAGLIGPETLFIGISGTFLSQPVDLESSLKGDRNYYTGALWFASAPELGQWINRLRALMKTRGCDAPLVLGGTKALSALQDREMSTYFDYFVVGKGESFFAEMLNRLKNKDPLPFRVYEGARYLHEECFGTSTTKVENQLWNSTDFITPGADLPIEIAKGCLYNCKFCYYEKQGSIRQTVDGLKTELTRNYELFGTTIYTFADDCFNDTRGKVEEICNALLSLPFKIEWVSYARVDVACKFPQTLDLMVESGARGLFWGIETLNHKVGKMIGKGTDPELVKEMLIRLKRDFGSRTLSLGSFIIGLPGESEESLQTTVDWILQSRALDFVYFPTLHVKPYSERLDKYVIDYADFARDPAKYGFEEVSFNPHYWKHSQMDLTRAVELSRSHRKTLVEHGIGAGWLWDVFQYAHVRSLGFTHEEMHHELHHGKFFNPAHKEALRREESAMKDYERFLKSLSRPSASVEVAEEV